MGSFKLPPLPTIRELLKLYKIRARKQLGQNFLLDMNIVKKLVTSAGSLKNSYVCEVGPGPGGITRAVLREDCLQLLVVEKDSRFLPGLQLLADVSGKKMRIFHGDILKFQMDNLFPHELTKPWESSSPNIHIIGNLPFNVSTPLIIKWLSHIASRTNAWRYGRTKLTLTFQKEVAERMVAPISSDARSRLSIMCQYLCDVEMKLTIPGKLFVPPADVDATVVHFTPLVEPKIQLPFHLIEKVVRHVFHYRKKMFKRGLETLFPPTMPELSEEIFETTGIDPATRPFMLTLEDFEKICSAYNSICERQPLITGYDYRSKENAKLWRKRGMIQTEHLEETLLRKL